MNKTQQMNYISDIIQKIESNNLGHQINITVYNLLKSHDSGEAVFECIILSSTTHDKKSQKQCENYLQKILTEFHIDKEYDVYWAVSNRNRIIFIYKNYYLYISYQSNEIRIVTDKPLTPQQYEALVAMISHAHITWRDKVNQLVSKK